MCYFEYHTASLEENKNPWNTILKHKQETNKTNKKHNNNKKITQAKQNKRE